MDLVLTYTEEDLEGGSYLIRRAAVTPDCCEQARLGLIQLCWGSIVLRTKDPASVYANIPPDWRLMSSSTIARYHEDPAVFYEKLDSAIVRFCPFCGEPLPKILPRERAPTPIHVPDRYGDYCKTCKERVSACSCYPPEFYWEPSGE